MNSSFQMTHNPQEWRSMRNTVRSRLLREMFRLTSEEDIQDVTAFTILILDQRASLILNSAVRTYDITKDGVALIEGLEKRRQPFPELEAIYFIEPVEESFKLIADDFKDEKRPMYRDVHIYLTRHVDNEELGKLSACLRTKPGLMKRIKTFTEVNIDFLAVEGQVFHLGMEDALVELYNEASYRREECKTEIVDRLVTLCATLNEYPFIRYHGGNALTQDIAGKFQEKMNGLLQSNVDFWWHGDDTPGHGDSSMRATLFVMDRADDPVSPFMHEYTYQAMVYDLLNVHQEVVDSAHLSKKEKKTIVSSGSSAKAQTEDEASAQAQPADKDEENSKKYLLTENDPLWTEYRHLHIAQVADRLATSLKEQGEKEIARHQRGEVLTLEEMAAVTRDLPEYKVMMEKHALHMQLTTSCMRASAEQHLPKCAELEQTMATGTNAQGKPVSKTALTTQLMELVQDPSIGVENTLRLLALYIITQRGIKEADRRRILEMANPPLPFQDQLVLTNLSHMGVTVESVATKTKMRAFNLGRLAQGMGGGRLTKGSSYTMCRYSPVIQEVVESFCTRNLNTESYPYVIEPPPMAYNNLQTRFGTTSKLLSVRTHGTNVAAAANTESLGNMSASSGRYEGSRVIVFFAGGVTFSELRAVHEVMKDQNREVIIGATHIIRPEDMLSGIQKLDNESLNKYIQRVEAKKQAAEAAVQQKKKNNAGNVIQPVDVQVEVPEYRPETFWNCYGLFFPCLPRKWTEPKKSDMEKNVEMRTMETK